MKSSGLSLGFRAEELKGLGLSLGFMAEGLKGLGLKDLELKGSGFTTVHSSFFRVKDRPQFTHFGLGLKGLPRSTRPCFAHQYPPRHQEAPVTGFRV